MSGQRAFLIALVLVCGVSLARAQSLGDVARATRENRQKVMQQKSVRTWSNDNIPKAPPSSGPTAAAGMSAEPPPPAQTTPAVETPGASSAPADAGADKKKSREYWQQQFKVAREKYAADDEQQRLSEDELSLLQIQQARELTPETQTQLESSIKAKTADVEAKRAQAAKTKKALDDVEKEFRDSGAPADWAKTE
ncbi:MAG: hypothetical protein ABSG54_10955 [Terriglobia bacterium]|jgi:hypothetical protein